MPTQQILSKLITAGCRKN